MPRIRLVLETSPSLAPNTAARKLPALREPWRWPMVSTEDGMGWPLSGGAL
jgi:hypothetical protein